MAADAGVRPFAEGPAAGRLGLAPAAPTMGLPGRLAPAAPTMGLAGRSTDPAAEPILRRPLNLARPAASAPRAWSLATRWHRADRRPLPVVLDAVVAVLAIATVGGPDRLQVAAPVAAVVVVVAGLTFGLYRRRSAVETQGIRWYLVRAIPTLVALAAALAAVEGPHRAVLDTVATVVALGTIRAGLWVLIGHVRRHGHELTPTLVIGPADRVGQLRRRLEVFPDAGLCFAGGFTPRPDQPADRVLQAVNRLSSCHDDIQVLIVADGISEEILRDVARYAGPRVDCAVVPPVGALCGTRVRHRLGDLAVIPVFTRPSWGNRAVKRAVDVVLASVALALCWPLLALTAIAIRRHDHGPALFRQERVGLDGRSFTVLKFRTMDPDAEERKDSLRDGNVVGGLLFKLGRDPRVTPIGDILRRTAVDELPQLLNVLRGDMSLVGPRPLPATAGDFDSLAQIRHEVRPGMTGLWQVRGGNALQYREMLDLDLAYVLDRSLSLDITIMLQTVPALLVRRSCY